MKKILTTLALVGVITTGAQAQSILISEINSNGTGGDFFEIYNYGATAVELGGWKWVDNASAVNGGPSFNGARAFAFDADLRQGADVADRHVIRVRRIADFERDRHIADPTPRRMMVIDQVMHRTRCGDCFAHRYTFCLSFCGS